MTDLNDMNLDDVQESQDFAPVKAGTYRLKVDSIERKPDGAGRDTINVRHTVLSSVTGEIETVHPGTPGGIFNTLYLHKPEALGFVRRFVEAHGISWDDFKANRDLNQFIGLEADAVVRYETKNGKTGEDLANPRNSIQKYITAKVAS